MAKKSWKEKVEDEFPDFVATVSSLKTDGLNSKMLEYSKHLQEVEETMERLTEEGSEVFNLRASVKEILGPVNDAKKAVKLKMRYVNELLKESGE